MAVLTVGMHEAKTHLSRLVRRVQDGDDVIVENNGRPVARLIPYVELRVVRPRGFVRGELWMADDFDAPIVDLEDAIYGRSE